MVGDPISDMTTQIRNAYLAKKEEVVVPYSRLREEIAKLLKWEGYFLEVRKFKEKDSQRLNLSLKLKYEQGVPALSHIRVISKPGQRIYTKARKLKRPSLGKKFISTPQGIFTLEEAKKRRLGGEEILEVW